MKALLPLLLLTAACGAKGPLAWPEGGPPAPPPGVEGPLTSEKMLKPPPQAAPARVDDPIRRSEEREVDEFDVRPR